MSKMDELIKNINKRAKEEIVTSGLSEYKYEKIPFTSPRMNYCTFGGLPVGKLIEFYGEEHGGKTTTALDIVAQVQMMENEKAAINKEYQKRKVLYCDCENGLDVEWAQKLGVNTDEIILLQPKSQSAEEIFQFICDAVDTGEIALWVLDSIGALVSAQELEKTLEDKTYAGVSKPLTSFAKRVTMLMQRTKTTGIGINQIRENIGSMYGGITTPGGKAWKHFCFVRMQFSRGKFVDEKGNELNRSADEPCGNIVQMSITKIKSCPPTRRTGFYTLNYETGIDYLKDLTDLAIKYDIIQKRGGWYNIVDIETGELLEGNIQGQARVYEFLEENQETLEKIESIVESKLAED